ncbi:MAG: hypothetical protein ACFHU9_05455 [Fluviicola sp.]
MAFNGTEGGLISLETGADMTERYRSKNPDEIKGHFFGKDVLQEILDQEGCMGIRMYYGLDEDYNKALVIVGADASENDMTSKVGDISLPCPSVCSAPNDLNS